MPEAIIPANIHTLCINSSVCDLLMQMISIPSCSGIPGRETRLAEFIRDFFTANGIKAYLQEAASNRFNVIAEVDSGLDGPALLLTGHLDTVPPYDMEAPFHPVVENGFLKGRGSTDMKAGLACMMESMKLLEQNNLPKIGKVIFAGVIDEEESSKGTCALIEAGIKADAAIVGEPSDGKICIAHRGLEWFEIDFYGITVHGGRQEEGLNAIDQAVLFIRQLEKGFPAAFQNRSHPLAGRSSMNIGKISGGTQPSTVAGHCSIQLDIRWIPGEDYQKIFSYIENVLFELMEKEPRLKTRLQVMPESIMPSGFIHAPMETGPDSRITKCLQQAFIAADHSQAELASFPAWSDGGLFHAFAGIPTIVCGPGEVETAHSSVEQVSISDLPLFMEIYSTTAALFCS